MAVPPDRPVTRPNPSTDATAGLLLLQLPPDGEQVSADGVALQNVLVPEIDPGCVLIVTNVGGAVNALPPYKHDVFAR